MAGVLGGLWRALAGGQPRLLPALVWIHLGLLLEFTDAQECSGEMCERPLLSISSKPASSNVSCFNKSQEVVVFCNPGFRHSGENYVATCQAGEWVPDGHCRVDLFSILVSVSASLVAILLFSLAIFVLCECHCFSRRTTTVTRARGNGNPGRAEVAESGQRMASHHHDNQTDDQDSFFTDDEEDNKQEAIYENQQY